MSDPVVWVTGLDDCKVNGFVDAMAYRHGEFTTPLYSQHEIDRLTAELAKARKIIAEQDGMLGRRPCGDNRCVKLIAANKRADEAQKLDSHAQVHAFTFGSGVSWKTVIEAAQLNYVRHKKLLSMTREETIDEEMKRRELFDMFYDIKSSAATVPAGHQVVPVEPTLAMCAAGFIVSEAEHDPAGVYRAMLHASKGAK